MVAPDSARLQRYAGHLARLTAWAALVWLVHAVHQQHLVRRQAVDLAAVPLETIRRHLSEAAAIGGDSTAVAGGRDLLGPTGDRVGTILQTSPAGDVAIGFSGPTDVLVVCDAELVVAGMEILSSGDTRDHVRAVERDSQFLASLSGTSLAELAAGGPPEVDAVGCGVAHFPSVAPRCGSSEGPTVRRFRFRWAPSRPASADAGRSAFAALPGDACACDPVPPFRPRRRRLEQVRQGGGRKGRGPIPRSSAGAGLPALARARL